MSKNYTKYTEKEWEDIKKDYVDNNLTYKEVCEKYNTYHKLCYIHLNGIKDVIINEGDVYDKLTVIKELEPILKYGTIIRMVRFRCECGNEVTQSIYIIKKNRVRSCGCLHTRSGGESKKGNLKSGYTLTYCTWVGMKQRCLNKNSTNYADYGGRGITICERWLEKDEGFLNFKEDMGERPEGRTIDRINVEGNYEPSNCRWATPKEQGSNKRKSKKNPE